jgi:uncharacterized membrane protein YfcA
MEFSQSLGFVLAIFVGMTLGMLGSGGSILSVPILVYVMRIEPHNRNSLFFVCYWNDFTRWRISKSQTATE